jgi:hypothetical protein
MVCWMGPERPTKQPIGLADRHVVDAGLTPAHQVIRTFCVAVSTVNGGKGGLSIEDPASRAPSSCRLLDREGRNGLLDGRRPA